MATIRWHETSIPNESVCYVYTNGKLVHVLADAAVKAAVEKPHYSTTVMSNHAMTIDFAG
jgi:hypothetical protein